MKKKIFALALATLAALSMAGCSKKPATPQELYLEFVGAYDAIAEATSIEFEQEVVLKDSSGLEIAEKNTIKKSDIDGNLDLSVEANGTVKGMSAGEQTSAAKYYYKDGYYYTDREGLKVKSEVAREDVLQITDTSYFIFEEDAVAEAVKENRTTTFTLDGEKAKTFLNEQLSFLQQLGLSDQMDYGAVTVVVEYEDNSTIKSYKLVVPMTYTGEAEGEGGSLDFSITMIVKQITGVTVDFPADLDSYMDETEMLNSIQSQMNSAATEPPAESNTAAPEESNADAAPAQ